MGKKKVRDYSFVKLDDLPERPGPVVRKVIRDEPFAVDYSVFQKTEGDRLRLKAAKKRAKEENRTTAM